jgi:hypothetical protein
MTFKSRWAAGFGFAALWCGLLGSAAAQGIYTCVDDKSRKLTSDRPIAECMDRVQKELNPSGTVRRILTPPLTAKDQEALEAKEKTDAETRRQQAEEKRRDRALMTRYPDRASHDNARLAALERVSEAVKTATKRTQELADQRKAIDIEQDFYKNSPGKVPSALKRRLDETDANMAAQTRLMADQEAEKKRITERFDTEMIKLQPRWDLAQPPATDAAGNAKKP